MSDFNELQDWREGPSPNIHKSLPAQDSFDKGKKAMRAKINYIIYELLEETKDGTHLINFQKALGQKMIELGLRSEWYDFLGKYFSSPASDKIALLEAADTLVIESGVPIIRKPTEDTPVPVYGYVASKADISSYIANAWRAYENQSGSIFCRLGVLSHLIRENPCSCSDVDFAVLAWFLHRARIERSEEAMSLRERGLTSRYREGKIGVQRIPNHH